MNDQPNSEVETGDEGNLTELQLLKRRASMMGITYSNNIGVETLRAKIQARMDGMPEVQETAEEQPNPLAGPEDAAPNAPTPELSEREKLRRKYMRLVRCRIQNLDPKKKDLRGEIFTVANEVLGAVRKFVPYGEVTDGGYHIPYCIYRQLEERRFVNITVTRDPRTGREVIKTNMAKEFSLEVLPPLTPTQLARLATAQAAAGSVEAA